MARKDSNTEITPAKAYNVANFMLHHTCPVPPTNQQRRDSKARLLYPAISQINTNSLASLDEL